jgi:hypothetical protein
MPIHLRTRRLWHPLLALTISLASPALSHAIDPKFELDPGSLGKKFAAPPSPAAARQEPAAPRQETKAAARQEAKGGTGKEAAATGKRKKSVTRHERRQAAKLAKSAGISDGEVSRYTVKPGDHLYRVLAREYGVTGSRADTLVAQILQLNHIINIHRLKTGSTLLIPLAQAELASQSAQAGAASAAQPERSGKEAPPVAAAHYQVKLAKIARRGESDPVDGAREVWNRLVPAPAGRSGAHFDYSSNAFSLSLDPERYPTLPAQDGGTILVDAAGTLPPLVRSLIMEKNPQVRIVSENAASPQRFYRSLLAAAQFYSFEEDFSVDFGSDPKITMRADFKIEKSPDSVLRQDVTLLNVGQNRRTTPDGLVRLLAGNGFRLVEAGTPSYQVPGGAGDLLYQVTEKEPKKILDSFLDALSVPFETGKSLDLYARENIGVRLDVPVDRYFEDNGQRYAVALFNGDPVTYTLVRLLETKGYRVIMLDKGDDFHSVADKVLSRLHIPGRFGDYDLWSARNVGYGVRMSGAMIRDNRNGDRNLFVTDRNLDPLVKELADINGYHLLGGR